MREGIKKITRVCVSLLIVLSIADISHAGKISREEKKLSSEEQALCHFMIAMETTAVSSKLGRSVEKIAKRSKDETLRRRAIGLLALYEAETKGKARSALATVAPFMLPPDLLENYLKSVNKSSKKPVSFPSASKWLLKNPELCVFAAKILASDKKYLQALAGFNKVGQKVENLPRALASDGMGDMQLSLKRYEQAVASYEFALQVISYLKKQSEYQNDPDKTVQTLEDIIRKKLAYAKELWDAERYGPGFVAYRAARTAEFAKDFLKAYVLYSRVRDGSFLAHIHVDIPKAPNEAGKNSLKEKYESVYSEAASLYRNKCLFKLSEDKKGAAAEKRIKKLDATVAFQKKLLKKYEKRMIPRVVAMYAAELAKDQRTLSELKKVPTGRKAARLAIEQLNAFIDENEFGLYRGEALQTLGDHFLETRLDLEKAFAYYARCYKWLAEVGKVKAALDAYRVPDKARFVSAPPPSEKKLTGWSRWIAENPLKPEQIINRINCRWYLDSLKARNGGMLSLCLFMKGDQEQALKAAKAVIKYEPLEKMFFKTNKRNSYSRLLKYYKRGWMYAEPDEISVFKGKLKTAILLGDFYYAVENEKKCLEIRKNLLDGKYGKLNKKQNAVARYYLAAIIFRQGNLKNAAEIIKPFREGDFKGMNCSAKAMIGLGNIYYQKNDKQSVQVAVECYEQAEKDAVNERTKETAMYYLANAYRRQKLYRKAERKYRRILKINPDSIWKNLIHKYTLIVQNK